MKNKSLRYLTQGAIIAAMYVAVNYAQNALIPGTTSGAIQFRGAEALCILACFTPAAIPGLTIGCFIANIANLQVLPLDVFIGSLATLLAAFAMYGLRNVKLFKLPVAAALMPALFNGVIVGLEIELYIVNQGFHWGAYLLTAAYVALGELAVLFILGLPLYKALEHIPALHEKK